jgi:hypothetical protein
MCLYTLQQEESQAFLQITARMITYVTILEGLGSPIILLKAILRGAVA